MLSFGQAEAMLTIGRLASYAGVTIRAVRHYHQIGLLLEPERDASGYRTYDADAVVRLIRIRTLAEAGVPLARVRELLDADPETFAAATAEIDQQLLRGRPGPTRSTAGGSRSWAPAIRWPSQRRWSTTWTACVPPEHLRRWPRA